MKTFDQILALLRCELWGEPLTCEIATEDIDGILAMAEEQGVGGLVANAILANDLPIGALKTVDVCTVTRLHELKSREMNRKVARFAGFLNRRNLKYVVMKGQTMAALYPHPLMRSCGDIDFYCPKDSYKKTQKAIEERLGVAMVHDLSEIHDNFEVKEVSFEMHSHLTSLGYYKHQQYWEEWAEKELFQEMTQMEIDGVMVSILPPNVNVVYILCHIMEHLTEKNFALKQLCDWAMVLHRYKDNIDREAFAHHLSELGLLKAGRVLGVWMVERVGFPKDEFPLHLNEKEEKWVTLIDQDFEYWTKARRDEKRISGGVSILHSLQTAGIVVRKTFRFFWLAPAEMFWRFPKMAAWSVRKRVM